MRILIVDDSVTTRDRLMEVLSRLPGVEHVHIAASALEATRAIHSGWPDAVVLDIDMPRGSGPRVLEALRTGSPRTLCVVLTNDSTLERREACLRAGADFFFDKAWEFQAAVDVIARLARGDAHTVAWPPCWTCFNQLTIPAWLYDVDTFALKAVNDAAVARYGYSREEFLAMTFADIQLGEAPLPLVGRQQHRDRDGAVLHVEVAVTLLNLDGKRLGVALALDISERVVAEQTLRASEDRCRDLEKKLEQLERMEAIAQRAGVLAHDSNSLLTVIMGRTQAMIDSLSPDHPARAEAVEILHASETLATKLRELMEADQPTNTKIRSTAFFISPPEDLK